MKNRKAQVGIEGLIPIISGLLVIGILIGVGILILGNMETSVYGTGSNNFTNETYTVTGAGVLVTGNGLRSVSYTSTTLINATASVNGGMIPVSTSNYTIVNGRLNFTEGTNIGYFGRAWNLTATYTWKSDTNESLALGEVSSATRSIPQTWLPVIVVISISGIILYMVIRGFGTRLGKAR